MLTFAAELSVDEGIGAGDKSSVALEMPCDHCGRAWPEMLVCLGCHQAHYCTTDCQRAAWLLMGVGKDFFHDSVLPLILHFTGWATRRPARRPTRNKNSPKLPVQATKPPRLMQISAKSPLPCLLLPRRLQRTLAVTSAAWRRQCLKCVWAATLHITVLSTASARLGSFV